MKEAYEFPSEDTLHEGTWLIWPHEFTYGMEYREEIEPIWIAMTAALHGNENVHIIAYDQEAEERITNLLIDKNVNMKNIDFTIAKSDDVWVRDTGPIFVYDENGALTIADFAFDGWGKKVAYKQDDVIPKIIAKDKDIPLTSIPEFVLEGGAVELDGSKTMMACKSSVISEMRNKGMTQSDAEAYATKYLGVTNFIWLDGVMNQDITDAHIDGIARFFNDETILTVSENDFYELYEDMPEHDYNTLTQAHNAEGKPYDIVELPLTDKNVKGLDYKGSYLSYYVGNEVILLSIYLDKNDREAEQIIAKLYPNKKIVAIDVTALYAYGGMLHCITQQQPIDNELDM